MVTSNIKPILLAAGRGHRFGSDKLLASIRTAVGEVSLIAASLQPWLAVFERITLVVQPEHNALKIDLQQSLLDDFGRVNFVVCHQADAGMGYSLAAGVAACSDADGWLIGLADMPLLQKQVIQDSLQALQSGALITAPCCNAHRGHPVGFASVYGDELISLTGDQGGRDILRRDAALIHSIETEDSGVLLDIDRPDELTRLVESYAHVFDRLAEQIHK